MLILAFFDIGSNTYAYDIQSNYTQKYDIQAKMYRYHESEIHRDSIT